MFTQFHSHSSLVQYLFCAITVFAGCSEVVSYKRLRSSRWPLESSSDVFNAGLVFFEMEKKEEVLFREEFHGVLVESGTSFFGISFIDQVRGLVKRFLAFLNEGERKLLVKFFLYSNRSIFFFWIWKNQSSDTEVFSSVDFFLLLANFLSGYRTSAGFSS